MPEPSQRGLTQTPQATIVGLSLGRPRHSLRGWETSRFYQRKPIRSWATCLTKLSVRGISKHDFPLTCQPLRARTSIPSMPQQSESGKKKWLISQSKGDFGDSLSKGLVVVPTRRGTYLKSTDGTKDCHIAFRTLPQAGAKIVIDLFDSTIEDGNRAYLESHFYPCVDEGADKATKFLRKHGFKVEVKFEWIAMSRRLTPRNSRRVSR